MKIYTLGSINMDLVITADTMPKEGETVIGKNFLTNPGGKGANQAVAAAKLGSESYMVGCVGNSFGDELIKTLESYGVRCGFVRKLENVSSGTAVIIINNANNRIIIDSGANGCIEENLIDEALATMESGDFLVSQLEIKEERVLYGFRKAKALGVATILNPSPAAIISPEIFRYTDYLIINEVEAEFYSGIRVSRESMDSLYSAMESFREMGVENVIITLGKDGSIGSFNRNVISMDGEKINAVDTTAAGDTYLGAFVSFLSKGLSFESAMRLATKASSITCQRMGAQKSIPYLNEIME